MANTSNTTLCRILCKVKWLLHTLTQKDFHDIKFLKACNNSKSLILWVEGREGEGSWQQESELARTLSVPRDRNLIFKLAQVRQLSSSFNRKIQSGSTLRFKWSQRLQRLHAYTCKHVRLYDCASVSVSVVTQLQSLCWHSFLWHIDFFTWSSTRYLTLATPKEWTCPISSICFSVSRKGGLNLLWSYGHPVAITISSVNRPSLSHMLTSWPRGRI